MSDPKVWDEEPMGEGRVWFENFGANFSLLKFYRIAYDVKSRGLQNLKFFPLTVGVHVQGFSVGPDNMQDCSIQFTRRWKSFALFNLKCWH